MQSQWQVIVRTSVNAGNLQWYINSRNHRKIGRIYHRLKQNKEIGTTIPKPKLDKYINCIILDSNGNQLHCGNGLAVYKCENLIELRQDIDRYLENEILRTMPLGLETDLLAVINYVENTT